MQHNFTRQAPLTERQLAEREQWFAESRAQSDEINRQAMIAQESIRQAQIQDALTEATGLPETVLIALPAWLKHNP
jgi:hypothetical protein